jgi:hypothetical protein
MIIFDLFEDANKKPSGVTEGEFTISDDPAAHIKLLFLKTINGNEYRLVKQGDVYSIYINRSRKSKQEFSSFDLAKRVLQQLLLNAVHSDQQGVAEGQYEIHHLDPEGRRKAIYHHGKGYTDDVVRKDTQYHQERNPRDTFRVFKDKQPFDWQGVAESLEDYERYQYIVTLKSGKRIRFLCGEDCDVKTYIERKYKEPVVDIKDQGIVGEPPVELLPGEMKEVRRNTNEVSPQYIERYKKEHGRRATAADQTGDYAKGHEHFKKINKLTKQQFQRGTRPEKVDEISNFMTQPTKPVLPEEQWKRQIRLLAKQYQANAGSLAALGRENGPDSAEAVAYEYLRDPSKIRVPGMAAPASAVNWDEVIRRLPMGLSGMALLQAAEEYLINNRGMLRSTVRSLLNNDENQRSLLAAYAKKNTTVNEQSDNEAVEQAIIRRIMVGRTDLLLKYGPKKVMQAVEDIADYVGAVDEIGSSDVSGWVAQVERTLGGMSEAANPAQQAAIAINMKKQGNKPKQTDEATATSTRLDPKCWTGKKIGNPKTKVKGGVRVNNCVPAESVAEDLTEEFNLIESIVELLAKHNGVDAEVIWEDLETLTEDELYVFAVTSEPIMESQGVAEDWQKANKRDKTDGMSQKAVNAYRRENPGSKLKTAVTTKPSKLKKGGKASKRRKSYCSRSKGQMNMHNISCAKTPDKAICKARRRWNC